MADAIGRIPPSLVDALELTENVKGMGSALEFGRAKENARRSPARITMYYTGLIISLKSTSIITR